MQGIFIDAKRPKSKAEIKRFLMNNPTDGFSRVRLEATSLHGNEYDGDLLGAPFGKQTFVGPDPYNDRKYYGTVTKKHDGTITVS